MEVTCSRCHQAIPADGCFCPTCGLPQLVYSADGDSGLQAQQRGPEPARDAGSIDWKSGMRAAIALAVPAGLLSSGISPLNGLFLFWMAGAAAWAVVLYMRKQRPARITMGAGARIGLVTGLIAAWLAFGFSAAGLFASRVILHQGPQMDSAWHEFVDKNQQVSEQLLTRMGASNAEIQAGLNPQRNLMLSPEGHAGFQGFFIGSSCAMLVLFAIAGGALSARAMARRRPNT